MGPMSRKAAHEDAGKKARTAASRQVAIYSGGNAGDGEFGDVTVLPSVGRDTSV